MNTAVLVERSSAISLRNPAIFSVLLLVGTLAPPLFMIIAYALWPSPPAMMQPGLIALAFVGTGHVFITMWFYLDRNAHSVFGARRLYYYIAPLLIMASTALIYSSLATPNRMYFYALFSLSAQWHHSRQNIGVYSFLSQSWKLGPVSQFEKNIISLSWLGGVFAGVRWYPLPVKDPHVLNLFYSIGIACYACVFLAAIFYGIREYRVHRRALKTGLFLCLCAFFLPAFLFTNAGAAASFGAAHSVQYYIFLWYVIYRSPDRVASKLKLPQTRWGWITAIAVAAAWPFAILFGLSYAYVSGVRAVGVGFDNTFNACLFGVIMGLVITHYLVDAGIWRMSDAPVRKYHADSFSFLRR